MGLRFPILSGLASLALASGCAAQAAAPRHMEALGRGLVALPLASNSVYVSWRLLATDPPDIRFNLYRSAPGKPPEKLNPKPIAHTTDFTDRQAPRSQSLAYAVRPVLEEKELAASAPFALPADASAPYLSIPLQTLAGYTPGDASAGDLDGDGEFELVLHQTGRGRDNSQAGPTTPPILEAYKLNGALLWRINLGQNIREGAHYTQFLVYDFDGDGRAELACKTADGTVDGRGKVLGDPKADYRNPAGYILAGPEYLTIFDGQTGAALATTNYIPARGRVADWGDAYGNRVDRFLACVAYLDGERPSVVMCRGYYTRAVLAAWDWRQGQLTSRWVFDSDDGTPGNREYRGQGNHNVSVADVDGDGRDEILYGAACIDDNGHGLYSTGLGHGDALHVSDLDPRHPGLEVFQCHERSAKGVGMDFRDARTGQILWSRPSSGDVGRALAADLDPRHPGCECWAAGPGAQGLFDCEGNLISRRAPRAVNFGVWWDGDLLQELLDRNFISKWDWTNEMEIRLMTAAGAAANNGSKATPCLCADLLGDWREEVVWRSQDNRELRIYATTIPAQQRLPTLMHDPVYRLSVAWQNVAYNQPTHTGYYLGEGMSAPPRGLIRTNALEHR